MQILILDDHWSKRELLKELLKNLKVQLIDEVETINSGLYALKSKKYDIVFVDFHLPDGNGNDFLRLGKKDNKMTKFILYTSDPIKTTKYKEMGFDLALDSGRIDIISDILTMKN